MIIIIIIIIIIFNERAQVAAAVFSGALINLENSEHEQRARNEGVRVGQTLQREGM